MYEREKYLGVSVFAGDVGRVVLLAQLFEGSLLCEEEDGRRVTHIYTHRRKDTRNKGRE